MAIRPHTIARLNDGRPTPRCCPREQALQHECQETSRDLPKTLFFLLITTSQMLSCKTRPRQDTQSAFWIFRREIRNQRAISSFAPIVIPSRELTKEWNYRCLHLKGKDKEG